jgi:hypothetical protein
VSTLGRWARKRLMADDTWERHDIVSRLAGHPETVLDVGGVASELAAFLPKSEVTALNLGEERADLHFDGTTIPFASDSFEVAVSLDVLEHIPPAEREGHVRELARVARERVILCCPLGTPEHVAVERELADWYRSTTGEDHRFLNEHLATGLPTETELRDIAAAFDGFSLRFQGDFRTTAELFRLGVTTRRRPTPVSLARYGAARLARREPPALSATSNPHTNRAFLIGRGA